MTTQCHMCSFQSKNTAQAVGRETIRICETRRLELLSQVSSLRLANEHGNEGVTIFACANRLAKSANTGTVFFCFSPTPMPMQKPKTRATSFVPNLPPT